MKNRQGKEIFSVGSAEIDKTALKSICVPKLRFFEEPSSTKKRNTFLTASNILCVQEIVRTHFREGNSIQKCKELMAHRLQYLGVSLQSLNFSSIQRFT